MGQHHELNQELNHDRVGTIVTDLVVKTYPFKIQRVQLAKVFYLEREEMLLQKSSKKLSDFELSGDNYLFWCYLTLNKSATRKNVHVFEQQRSQERFVFGQLTCCQGKLFCDCKEIDFFSWARIARIKQWFEAEDIRDVRISYYEEEFGKLTEQLLEQCRIDAENI